MDLCVYKHIKPLPKRQKKENTSDCGVDIREYNFDTPPTGVQSKRENYTRKQKRQLRQSVKASIAAAPPGHE